MYKDSKVFLINRGINQKLCDQLDEKILIQLVSFAMDHINVANLTQTLIQLASMELRGKNGAAALASFGIATIEQLKTLTSEQIILLKNDYEQTKDTAVSIKNVRKFVIATQQEKLYFGSNGAKGEYYLYKDEIDSDEDIIR